MTTVKITKRVVDSAEARASRYTVFDSELRGFGLRVFPTGAKSYVFEYRPGEGGRRAAKKRITLGRVGDFTPDEARKRADKLRSRTKVGEDPQADAARQRQAHTLAEVAERFLADHVEPKRKAATKTNYGDTIRRIVLPKLGTRKAKDIARADVAKLHLDWRHTPFQANRILTIIGSMYGFAGKHGLVPEGMNPARGVEKYPEDGRERFLSTDELLRLGEAIREAETSGIAWKIDPSRKTKHVPKLMQSTVIDEHAAAAIRLLIFTGARLREILTLKWDYVDLGRGLLLLPDSKTRRKTIVLNAPALEILTSLLRVGAYVIAGRHAGTENEKPRSDLKRPWTMVRKRAGLEDVRIHDLRHNFAAFGAGGGMGLPIIGKLLGHTQAATTQRYAHLDADPLRRASNTIGAILAAALGQKTGTAEVVRIPNRLRGKRRD